MAKMHPQRRPVGVLVKIYPKLSETFILEELLGLERLGERLHVFALQPPTDAVSHDAVARVAAPVTYLPELRPRRFAAFAVAHLALAATAPLRYLSALRAAAGRAGGLADFLRAGWLVRALRRAGIGHLHTHFISRPADVAELVARLGIPFSISAHAKDIYLSPPADLRRKLSAARFTVTCTEYNRRTLATIAPDATIHRMYHGVDAVRFDPVLRRPDERPPLVLAVGRLREKKGFDTLVDACALLRSQGIAFRCEIVGYGDQHPALAARIARSGLEGTVALTGKLAREAVIERYARAAVFVQPSRVGQDGDRDGIPNVLLEAMAMALPVVSTPVSGIPELVDHDRTGLLVAPDRPAELAAAITRLLADPALGRRLAAAGRRAVQEDFDNDHNLGLLRGLLESPDECTSHADLAAPGRSPVGLA